MSIKAVQMGDPMVVEERLERIAPADYDFVVTFDGGARDLGGRVAGAGACLWGGTDHLGDRPPVAHAIVALPDDRHAQVAEAWGCAAAIMLVLKHVSRTSRVLFVGDNLAVVRFAAAQGTLRQPSMAGPLHTFLSKLSLTGHLTAWVAVRRRHNKAADALATRGVLDAAELHHGGTHGKHVHLGLGWPQRVAQPW